MIYELKSLLDKDLGGDAIRNLVLRAVRLSAALHHRSAMIQHCLPQIAIENALEDLHVPFVHRTTFHRLQLTRLDMVREGRNSAAMYRVDSPGMRRSLGALEKHFPEARADYYFHVFLYPHTCVSSLGGFTVSMQTYEPHDKGTLFVTRLYRGHTTLPAPAAMALFDAAVQFNAQVFEEDRRVCERIRGHRWDDMLHPVEEQRIVWYREELSKEAS